VDFLNAFHLTYEKRFTFRIVPSDRYWQFFFDNVVGNWEFSVAKRPLLTLSTQSCVYICQTDWIGR
jgi:hypothetical protein